MSSVDANVFLRLAGIVASPCGGVVVSVDGSFGETICLWDRVPDWVLWGLLRWCPCALACGLGCGVFDIFGEFDPGSGRTLAACLTHASRTVNHFGGDQWRTGE